MQIPVTMHKAEKYYCIEQHMSEAVKTALLQNFGCVRKVYNLYVAHLYEQLEKTGYRPGDEIPSMQLPAVAAFKKEFEYLKQADSLGLAAARADFEKAVARFNGQENRSAYTKSAMRRRKSGGYEPGFRDLQGMPKFHSKAKGYFSYTTYCQYPGENSSLKKPTVRLDGCRLHLPKIKEDIVLRIHRPLPGDAVIRHVTVSMDADGKIYAAINYTYTTMMDMDVRNAVMSGDSSVADRLKFLALDYAQADFYVDSEGRKANCPKPFKKSEARLAKLQRRLSHMQRGSSNYEKTLAKIRRLHIRIKNQRLDFANKESRRLADAYDVVVVEDIDLRSMGELLSLGKNLHDNGFGMFRDRLSYKLKAKGSVLVKVDKWFPSSKTCSACGFVNKDLDLDQRSWACPECGAEHDRDVNAAANILAEGKRIFADYFATKIHEEEQARAKAEAVSAVRKSKKRRTA